MDDRDQESPKIANLSVVHPGLQTTIQDLGRTGYRAWGVPIGGAFDLESHTVANALLGNPVSAATLELTLLGGSYRAEGPLAIALAGAPMPAEIERADGGRTVLSIPQSTSLEQGDCLRFGGTSQGARVLLAVLGGWQTPLVLGSRSSETPLKSGDLLPAMVGKTRARRLLGEPWSKSRTDQDLDIEIRILEGPDFSGLRWQATDGKSLRYRVGSESNRMGLRLEGPILEVESDPERLSTPVAPGTVQVAGGLPIVLGVACGTMGGYPHVFQVISADLVRLAQVRPGDWIQFLRISLEEARRLDQSHRQRLRDLRVWLSAMVLDEG